LHVKAEVALWELDMVRRNCYGGSCVHKLIVGQ